MAHCRNFNKKTADNGGLKTLILRWTGNHAAHRVLN